VTASGDQTARLWDVEKAETVAILRGHTCSLKSVAIAPHSKGMFCYFIRSLFIWANGIIFHSNNISAHEIS